MIPARQLELTDHIRELFQDRDEVVLETVVIQAYLADPDPIDSVRVMEWVREIAEANNWTLFVFDYGALIRFCRPTETSPPAP